MADDDLRAKLAGLIDVALPEDALGFDSEDVEAAADAIIAAGWRPPLPTCGCAPFDTCPVCYGPEQQREAQIRALAECEEIIPSGPEDAEQCPELREPGSVFCAAHQPALLPNSETSVVDRIAGLFANTNRRHMAQWLGRVAIAIREGLEWPALEPKPVDDSGTELPREIALISAERRRVLTEGRTPEQDDRYVFGQMIYAAAAYLGVNVQSPPVLEPGRLWPWEFRDFKPRDPESNLVRAGQLIAAEIARLQRIRARAEREANRDG